MREPGAGLGVVGRLAVRLTRPAPDTLQRNPAFAVDVVHVGTDRARVDEAARVGVKSVPALVLDGVALHIHFGVSLDALR